MTGAKVCPCGCGEPAGTGKLLALRCWRRLPVRLKADVNDTWSAFAADQRDMVKLRAYRSARDAAVDVAKRNRERDQS